jgi:hypothetical protein
MLPIGDDNSARRTVPVVTYVLIALNVMFLFVELSGGRLYYWDMSVSITPNEALWK